MNETLARFMDRFSPAEGKAILAGLGRAPNAVEEALFAVLWSEHCSYKHTRQVLAGLPTEGPAVVMGPGQNAGVLRLGQGYALAVKIESHNHPSAVEPFQGAATGLGGIMRDVLATGARPIAFLDALFFGPGEASAFHRRGVVAGIGHYGNAVGVPTVGGEWHEEDAYEGHPLVNCLCAGLLREEEVLPSAIPAPGLALLLLGAPTGRDGLGGAAFASETLTGADDARRVEVQVGDPFLGKLLVEATLAIRERGLLVGLGDLGAAGLTSAVAEMASRGGVGVELDLDQVHLREEGLSAAEILLSESQERMLLVVRPEDQPQVAEIAGRFGLPVRTVGCSTDHRRFVVRHGSRLVADVPVDLLARGCPVAPLAPRRPLPRAAGPAHWPAPDALFARLAALRPAGGPRSVYRTYDWAVGIRTVLGPGHDAAVLRLPETGGAVALVTKSAPRAASVDPRQGAALAVAWAALSLAAVGARPLGLTDGLNFGAPEDGEVAFQLLETVAGLAAAARALDIPVVSGNVSLYNSSPRGAIWPTAVVGAVGLLPPGAVLGSSQVPRAGLVLGVVGGGAPSLSGTLAQAVAEGSAGPASPPPALAESRRLVDLLLSAWAEGLLLAAHTVDEGGLLLALWQMTAAAGLSALLEAELTRAEAFGESGGTVAVALAPEAEERFSELCRRSEVPWRRLGTSAAGPGRARVDGAEFALKGV